MSWYKQSNMDELSSIQCKAAARILGVDPKYASIWLEAMLGWNPIELEVIRRKWSLYIQIQRHREESVVKRFITIKPSARYASWYDQLVSGTTEIRRKCGITEIKSEAHVRLLRSNISVEEIWPDLISMREEGKMVETKAEWLKMTELMEKGKPPRMIGKVMSSVIDQVCSQLLLGEMLSNVRLSILPTFGVIPEKGMFIQMRENMKHVMYNLSGYSRWLTLITGRGELRMETGRSDKPEISPGERFCCLCHTRVDDLSHFLLGCSHSIEMGEYIVEEVEILDELREYVEDMAVAGRLAKMIVYLGVGSEWQRVGMVPSWVMDLMGRNKEVYVKHLFPIMLQAVERGWKRRKGRITAVPLSQPTAVVGGPQVSSLVHEEDRGVEVSTPMYEEERGWELPQEGDQTDDIGREMLEFPQEFPQDRERGGDRQGGECSRS